MIVTINNSSRYQIKRLYRSELLKFQHEQFTIKKKCIYKSLFVYAQKNAQKNTFKRNLRIVLGVLCD
jgi:hypothetical protein